MKMGWQHLYGNQQAYEGDEMTNTHVTYFNNLTAEWISSMFVMYVKLNMCAVVAASPFLLSPWLNYKKTG